MKTPILLHIPEPCHENWDAMTPQDKGRHCESCNKIVVDFSVMSDRQVLDYFKKATGNTCGRFHDDQLQRPLIEPQKQTSKWGYFLASFIGLIMTTKTFAQQKLLPRKVVGKPNIERRVTANREDYIVKGDIMEIKGETKIDTIKKKAVGDTILPVKVTKISYEEAKKASFVGSVVAISENEIKKANVSSIADVLDGKIEGFITGSKMIGRIVDEKNNQIAGATIKIKGTRIGVLSDVYGKFELKNLGENNKLTLTISSIGYETKEINIEPKDLNGELNIVLKESKQTLDEVFVQVPYGTVKKTSYMGSSMTISCKKIKPSIKDSTIKVIQKIFNKESIKIYPNPAVKNSIIHISIKDAGEYALQMFDMQSKLMTARKISINNNNETIEFQLPTSAITGTYFIRISNEKTQKQVTEKIIVE